MATVLQVNRAQFVQTLTKNRKLIAGKRNPGEAVLGYPENLERAGLGRVVREAEQKRDELEARAAKPLAPLGVTPSGLRSFVDSRIVKVGKNA